MAQRRWSTLQPEPHHHPTLLLLLLPHSQQQQHCPSLSAALTHHNNLLYAICMSQYSVTVFRGEIVSKLATV